MAVEFRTGVFGFNRNDVLEYIHKKDADMKIQSAEYKNKIKALEEELTSLKAQFSDAVKNNAELSAENASLTATVQGYKAREDEIESLSRKIGKLYLVSKSSAKSIVDRAEENAEIITTQANIRLQNIEQTEQSLHDITRQIVSASQQYVKELNTIETSLSEAKQIISENNAEKVRISEEFSDIYQKLG